MAQILNNIKDHINQQDIEADISGIEIVEFTQDIKKYFQSCHKLQVLVLSDCKLESLNNFPVIPTLQALDLSNNNLKDDCGIESLLRCVELTQVFLNNNSIKQFNVISQLKALPKLIEIDCDGNDVSTTQDYRDKIFQSFPVIEIVDKKDKQGNIIDDDEAQFEDDEDDEDDEQDYEDEDEEDEFNQDEYEEEESDPKPKKKGKRK